MKRFDVIVVGAGPAGSTAARECAERGLSVVLVDKAVFPRDKPCGGGVNVRAARLLPFDLTPVIDRTAYGLEFAVRGRRPFRRYSRDAITYLTERRRLDAFLVERAIDRGVTLRQRAPIRDVSRGSRGVTVRAGSEAFEGRVLIAADGANGRTAKLAGVRADLAFGVAMEANVEAPARFAWERERLLALDLGCVRGGFGWLFPKRDHFNVGVGGWLGEAPGLRAQLDDLTRSYGLDPASLSNVQSHRLPIRTPNSPLFDGDVVLVGDAAGLVDPLSGEGIYAAFASGRAAAEQIALHLGGAAPDLRGYARAIEHGLGAELALGLTLHDLLQVAPDAIGLGLRNVELFWEIGFRLLRGEATLLDLEGAFGPLWPAISLASSMGRRLRAREGATTGRHTHAREEAIRPARRGGSSLAAHRSAQSASA